MGSANPRSFSRGKRGIAGTLVFVMFDRDALIKGLEEHNKENRVFHRIGGTLNNDILSIDEWDAQMTGKTNANVQKSSYRGNQNTSELDADAVNRTNGVTEQAEPVIADEIPPFDITISMANEYGKAAVMVLYGVEILNQGSEVSRHNTQTQVACTCVARRRKTLEAVTLKNGTQSK